MASLPYVIDHLSVQDRDLLTRLTHYFETLEMRLAQGQGWLIFNANGQRAAWLGRLLPSRLAEYRPLISSFVMPWRDFALNAYVSEIELPGRAATRLPDPTTSIGPVNLPAQAANGPTETGLDGAVETTPAEDRLEREYRLASGVARATSFQMRQCDLLVVLGVRPRHAHEVALLDDTVSTRHTRRRATMLVTPLAPHEMASSLGTTAGGEAIWRRLWTQMYERSLIAL